MVQFTLANILVVLFASFNACFGQTTSEEIETDRPGIGQSAYTLEKYQLQLECGGNYEWNTRAINNAIEDLAYGEIYLRYGLFKNLEVRLSSSYLSDKDYLKNTNGSKTLSRMKGFLPFSLGLKSTLCKAQGIQPKTAVLGTVGIPFAASSSFQLSRFSLSFFVPMEWNLKENGLLTVNAGVYSDGSTPRTYLFGSASYDYSFLNKWTFFLELYSNYNDQTHGQLATDAGLVFKMKPNLQVDVSYGYGISKNSPNGFLNAGLSYKLALKK
ncbi:MAG: hypothetical protein RI922_1084 [Bacteroidota bacterium]|jgi:hypothetical protein